MSDAHAGHAAQLVLMCCRRPSIESGMAVGVGRALLYALMMLTLLTTAPVALTGCPMLALSRQAYAAAAVSGK